MRGFFRQRRSVSPPGHPYDRTGPGEHAGPGARTGPGGRPRVLGVRGLRARGIRTGLRWKLSAAIALVGALVAIALSLVVHNAARVSMLDNARDLADDRVLIAQRNYELSGRQNFPNAQIDDPALPPELRRKIDAGRRATYVSERPDGVTDIWRPCRSRTGT